MEMCFEGMCIGCRQPYTDTQIVWWHSVEHASGEIASEWWHPKCGGGNTGSKRPAHAPPLEVEEKVPTGEEA